MIVSLLHVRQSWLHPAGQSVQDLRCRPADQWRLGAHRPQQRTVYGLLVRALRLDQRSPAVLLGVTVISFLVSPLLAGVGLALMGLSRLLCDTVGLPGAWTDYWLFGLPLLFL